MKNTHTKHTADCLERAIEIGRESLNNLSPKPKEETRKVIELTGTKKERIDEAFRLAYNEVSNQALEHFREVYEKVGIRLLPSAERLYKQYGGVFRKSCRCKVCICGSSCENSIDKFDTSV